MNSKNWYSGIHKQDQNKAANLTSNIPLSGTLTLKKIRSVEWSMLFIVAAWTSNGEVKQNFTKVLPWCKLGIGAS